MAAQKKTIKKRKSTKYGRTKGKTCIFLKTVFLFVYILVK